ncbi:hypothetical protein LUTEI9C_40061 [Luteimonas sp. 9C]|uniref:hypothetical protein n=1 Tax=Luteimonas sp. 9C TaxID=2653148 RepID=UPI0012EF0B70|nr:hypothetical protein [Luteimonas sp. 9C]VXB61261.1 hypothetical protein LUTEI9C_40061 [Luteimonas sp. 9C]
MRCVPSGIRDCVIPFFEYLVWFVTHYLMAAAIVHGKRMKALRRVWKPQLIESTSPDAHDLYPDLV